MNRRTFLRRATPLSAAIAVAGCTTPDGGADDRNASDGARENETERDGDAGVGTAPIPMLEDPPDAVYRPGHRTAMRMLEPIDAGAYRLAPMLSYPHPFWLVTGSDRELVEPTADRGIHLMLVVWDPETGVVLPGNVEPRATITGADGWTETRPLWPMLSQEMGIHFGDNVTLPGDGRYTVSVDLPPLSTRRTGAFAERFDDGASATFDFTYDQAFREAVVDGIELLERDRWGTRGALEPMGNGDDGNEGMQSEIPYSALPPAQDYPGTPLREPDTESQDGLAQSGDAAFVITLLESGSRLAGGDDRYLLVSPRTPYNRVPLTNMSLRVVVERDGSTVVDRDLVGTLDDAVGFHYGRTVGTVRPGDSVTVTVESPPQLARHQGYETAFFGMEPLEFVVPTA
ncbi:iron transporter [Haloarchaeobius amylolyticus]|uniref:Iron transporter n=1 Tax=Haloarchaeobius amylolyticus TaxID=1198296 RepID=A0ABD6BJX7_9EURY